MLKTIGIVAAMATTMFASASAEELTGTLKKIKDTGVVTIGHRDSSVPFSYLDENQQPVGYAIDICLSVVDALKSRLETGCT